MLHGRQHHRLPSPDVRSVRGLLLVRDHAVSVRARMRRDGEALRSGSGQLLWEPLVPKTTQQSVDPRFGVWPRETPSSGGRRTWTGSARKRRRELIPVSDRLRQRTVGVGTHLQSRWRMMFQCEQNCAHPIAFSFACVRPNLVRCDLGVRVRLRCVTTPH